MKLTNPLSGVKKKSYEQEILQLNWFLSVNYLWSKDEHFNFKVSVEFFFFISNKTNKSFYAQILSPTTPMKFKTPFYIL